MFLQEIRSAQYDLKSKLLEGGCTGDYIGSIIGAIKGDTKSSDPKP